MRRAILAAVLLLGFVGSASAQVLNSGQVMGNGTSNPAAPTATSISPLFDQALCATNGQIPERLSGTWQCVTPSTTIVQPGYGIVISVNGVNTSTISAPYTALAPGLMSGMLN